MRFFFDNNLSPRISKALNALEGERGHCVVHLREMFPSSTPDEEWMHTLGSEGDWVVITTDYRITKNPHEVAAWKESGLTVFFLKNSWLKIGFWDQSWQLIKRWPKLMAIADRNPKGQRFMVPIKGTKIEAI